MLGRSMRLIITQPAVSNVSDVSVQDNDRGASTSVSERCERLVRLLLSIPEF